MKEKEVSFYTVINKLKVIISVFMIFGFNICIQGQVTLENEIKISDAGLYFDGDDVGTDTTILNNPIAYDFAFGRRITPHGDCIKEYNGYVFMTWYKGGENDRHVMLSRYNPTTGVVKTITFGHQHNGYLNISHIGESHNTIALGISPSDGTIHLLYDLHAYSKKKPLNGSLANDYFRYSYSKKNVATISDDQFTLDQFVKDSDGDYKHLNMREDTDYQSLTYPNFFLNEKDELFMWIRQGGSSNGAYKFCKYDGDNWSTFTQFNVLNASLNTDIDYNWGLYGDIKFVNKKMRIGFHRRSVNPTDDYSLNNGFHYAYSDDPNGLTQWKDHLNNNFTLPLLDSDKIKISEPGDMLGVSGKNTVKISAVPDWTVTKREDIHMVTTVGTGSDKVHVHTYRKASDSIFTTSTNFPGGNLYTYKNDVYLIGLNNGYIFIEKADGGTNNWTTIYQATEGKKFRHGNVYISDVGKLYFYLMEQKSGSAQPIYLQIIDLDLPENKLPIVSFTSLSNNSIFQLGDQISLDATAMDFDGSIEKVNFKIDGAFYKRDNDIPYSTTFTPTKTGIYVISAKAFDDEGAFTEIKINIEVKLVTTLNELNIDDLLVSPTISESGKFRLNKRVKWKVINLNGQKVLSGNEYIVDLTDKKKGVYILKTREGKSIQFIYK